MASLFSIVLVLAFACCVSSSVSRSNRKELRVKNGVNQQPVRQLGRSSQSNRVDPSQVIQLSWHPRAFLYRSFLSNEECDHLISLAHGKLQNSLTKDNGSTKIMNINHLQTSVTPLDVEDDIVARIEDRISAWTFLPSENSEHVKVLHYLPEETNQPLDYYSDKAMLESREPLMATVLLYLSNVSKGGETLFLESELKDSQKKDDTWSDCAQNGYSIKPSKGNALLIFNLQLSTELDKSSPSSRCPIFEDEQWCAAKLFYVRPIITKKSSIESDSNGCTDEDDNCPEWAAIGECQRNPVYMIGTPDYYGSCRKSCGVC